MDKLQKVKVALRESERWFRAIFNQTFGFLGLIKLIGILMQGNQTALKFAGITSNKVILCALWKACLSDFSPNVQDLLPSRGKALNFRPTLVKMLAQRLGLLLVFLHHNVKSQARGWTISKEIQRQLRRIVGPADTMWTHGSRVKPFSNQSGQVIFLMPVNARRLGRTWYYS